MKNLLIPIEESELLPSVLQSAVLVARRFGSYLEGLHVRPDFAGSIAASGMGAPYRSRSSGVRTGRLSSARTEPSRSICASVRSRSTRGRGGRSVGSLPGRGAAG